MLKSNLIMYILALTAIITRLRHTQLVSNLNKVIH